jgi:hypothetical protein
MDETSLTLYVETLLDAMRLVQELKHEGFTKSYYIDRETGERTEFEVVVTDGMLHILLVTPN